MADKIFTTKPIYVVYFQQYNEETKKLSNWRKIRQKPSQSYSTFYKIINEMKSNPKIYRNVSVYTCQEVLTPVKEKCPVGKEEKQLTLFHF